MNSTDTKANDNIDIQDYVPIGWTNTTSSIIKVIGVGGGGGNAVNYMYTQGIHNVDFVVCNTDAQALRKNSVPRQIRLGKDMTDGLGAGNKPEVGQAAALESADEIRAMLHDNTKMVFITAGMGGGTGTGAAPVIARMAKESGILTVAIVTLPFMFEGNSRYQQALHGVELLKDHVDALLVINNEKLREMNGNLPISKAFSKADDVLATAAKGIAELITNPGIVNVDFADVSTIMKDGGITIMGSARAAGEGRARTAVEAALTSPLLNNNNIKGASRILLNITSGDKEGCEVTMDEFEEITTFVRQAVAQDALTIWGTETDESLNDTGELIVTVVATHFDPNYLTDELSGIGQERMTFGQNVWQETSNASGMTVSEREQSLTEILTRPAGQQTPEPHTATAGRTQPDTSTLIYGTDIEELENVPAYIRKQEREKRITATDVQPNDMSDMTLSSETPNEVHLKEENAYFSPPD